MLELDEDLLDVLGGEFAVRGGILDVFPPTEQHPLRVDFFGDEIDEVSSFAVADQRTIAADEAGAPEELGLWAPPCRELLITDEVRERAKVLAEQLRLAEALERSMRPDPLVPPELRDEGWPPAAVR